MKKLSQADINRYKQDIERNGVQGVVRTYADLLEKGYGYAGWAKGVAEADSMVLSPVPYTDAGFIVERYPQGTVTGRSAMLFMKDTTGKALTQAKIDQIRIGMAQGYVNFLAANLREPRDVDFRSMRDFHKEVFEQYGLSINNWTLETPMKLIGYYEGKAVREKVWEALRETRGEGAAALAASAKLYNVVKDYADGSIRIDDQGRRINDSGRGGVLGLDMGAALGNVRRISDADAAEARQWLQDVSRIKPLLFSQAEQAQEMQYAAVGKQDDFLSATNDLIARLKSGDRTALSDFMGRDDVRQIHRESAITAQAFLDRNPGYGEEMLPNRFQRLGIEDMSERFRNLYKDSREQLAGYYQEQGIRYREEALDNTAAALAAAGCRSSMQCVSMISVVDGEVNIGDKSFPDFRMASVNARDASLTEMQESMAAAQQTEREFEEQARQREMERMVQSHSRGMSMA